MNPLIEPSVIASDKLNRHYLTKGDVVILSKGHHGFGAHTYQADKSPAVASSVFLVLRDMAFNVLPEYIAWYVNLESTQEELKSYSRGTALPSINKKILGDLEIEVPSQRIQKLIVELDSLKKQESYLLKKLDELKSTELEIQLKSIIQNHE